MFCDKCGADNNDTAKFCRKCGLPIEELEEATRVRDRRVEVKAYRPPAASAPYARPLEQISHEVQEREIFSISPTLKFVYLGYVLAAFGAVLLVAFTSAFFFQWMSITLSVIVGLLLFLIPAYYHLRQRLIRYRMTETQLEIDTGLLSRSTRNIPLRRIQDVTLSATAAQRLFGYGDVEIDNASEEGGKVVLKNIDSPRRYADMLLKQMGLLER